MKVATGDNGRGDSGSNGLSEMASNTNAHTREERLHTCMKRESKHNRGAFLKGKRVVVRSVALVLAA